MLLESLVIIVFSTHNKKNEHLIQPRLPRTTIDTDIAHCSFCGALGHSGKECVAAGDSAEVEEALHKRNQALEQEC